MIVFLGRWSLKGFLLVTLRKKHCMFIVYVSLETELHDGGVLLRRWSWKGHSSMTLTKMVLKWAFIGDTE